MKRIAFVILLVAAMCCVFEAQTSPPAVVFHGNCATGLPRFEEWYQKTRLPHEPYAVAEKRKQQMLDNYPKLKLQMSLEDVEKLLGTADFATGTPAPHLATAPEPADKRCIDQLAYIVKKNHENMTDMEDVAIYLSFSRDGKLYWAAPQNLPSLKPLGSPTDGIVATSSQRRSVAWKEYIFADDGFAITLPDAPGPHPDATIPEFTVYSVSLPGNAMFSLRVSHRKRDCPATLAQLKEGALRGESGIDPSSVKNPSFEGNQGLEYEYTLGDYRDLLDRFYCVNGKFYSFSTSWPRTQAPPAEVQRVVGSFRLLKTEHADSPQ